MPALDMQPARRRVPARVLPPQVRAPQGALQWAWTTPGVLWAAHGHRDVSEFFSVFSGTLLFC